MEKTFLSQEEIDGLLGAGNQDPKFILSAEEKDVLGEIGNISAGSASTALSEILNQRVIINAPSISFTTLNELHQRFATPYLLIEIEYTSGITGKNLFILKSEDAAVIANIMMGGTGRNVSGEIDEFTLSAVSEAMNQMIGYSATSMSEMFNRIISISPPQVRLISVKEDATQIESDILQQIVVIAFQLKIGDLLESQIMLVMNIDMARSYAIYLMEDTVKGAGNLAPRPDDSDNGEAGRSIPQGKNITAENPLILHNGNLNLILDVPLRLSVLLGRTKKSIGDILKLTHGSIVELERFENEAVDILVNDKLIARGEVVVVKEYFGVRITDIISTENRLKNLVQK